MTYRAMKRHGKTSSAYYEAKETNQKVEYKEKRFLHVDSGFTACTMEVGA